MAIKKRPVSPRQKMINLMYVVLMAMLALNISTEVLDGFSIVEESLKRTTANSSKENLAMMADLDEQMKANPVKVKEWFEKAQGVKSMTDSLYDFAQQLKEAIVKEADGKAYAAFERDRSGMIERGAIEEDGDGIQLCGNLFLRLHRQNATEAKADQHEKFLCCHII